MSAHLLLRSWSSRRLALTSLYGTTTIRSRLLHSGRRPAASKSLLLPELRLYNVPYRFHGHSHGSSKDKETIEQQALRPKLSAKDVKAADRITWIGVWLNVLLSGLKGVAGIAFHSSGLLADAVHSISDLPYGYGKFETIGALSVSLLLVGGSVGIIAHSLDSLFMLIESLSTSTTVKNSTQLVEHVESEAMESLIQSVQTHAHGMVMHPAALGIAALSVVAKEALFRTTISIGQRVHSSVLVANAWHHRSDAVMSMVAMGGIGLSLAGYPFFDPLAGISVGGIILKMGAELGWDSTKELCDAKLSDTTIKSLEKALDGVIESSDGEVLGVRQLRSRKVGRHIHVDLILVVNDASAVHRAVEWKQKVKSAIKHKIPQVNDIVAEITTPKQLAVVAAAEVNEKCDQQGI